MARCESTDYYAPFNGYHIGAFQIAPLHAGIFNAYGWEYYADGDDPYKNAVVALDLLTGANGYWPRHWPNCGWR